MYDFTLYGVLGTINCEPAFLRPFMILGVLGYGSTLYGVLCTGTYSNMSGAHNKDGQMLPSWLSVVPPL